MNVFHHISQAFKGIFRNSVMSLVSILVLTSCLVLMGGFTLLFMNIEANLDDITQMNEIVVYLDFDITEDEITGIEAALWNLDNVAEVTFISKADGLETMKEQFADYEFLFDDIGSEENPLSDVFQVKYKENSSLVDLDYEIRYGLADRGISGVRKVNSRLDLASNVESFKNGVSFVAVWFLILLFIIGMFVIINTIKLSVYARREEITVMRYVGATGAFIVMPFVWEGIIIGIISAVISLLVTSGFYSYIASILVTQTSFIKIIPFGSMAGLMSALFFGVGIITGIIGSSISLRRYVEA